MKTMKGKRTLVIILALMILTLGNVISAEAASAWSFQTKSGKQIAVNETITMEKNEFQDFNLCRTGIELKDSDKKYVVTWSSDNEKAVWIDAKNGKARADKFKKLSDEPAQAVITAKIKNKTTGAIAYRKFNVVVGSQTIEKTKIRFQDEIDPNEALQIGESYTLETQALDAKGNQITDNKTKLYYVYFCESNGITLSGSSITPLKAGEYTIISAGFYSKADSQAATNADNADFKAELHITVEPDVPKISEIRQVNLNTVELTFNKEEYAKAIINDNKLLKVSYSIGVGSINTSFQAVTLKEGDNATVVVMMFSNLVEGLEYTFRYEGYDDVKASVIGSDMIPAYIKLIGGKVEIDTDYPMEVVVYSNKGVDITDVIYNPLSFDALVSDNLEYSFLLSENTLYFFTEGKKAVIQATLDMGYDEKGNELKDLTSTAQFESIPKVKPIYQSASAYAIDTLTRGATPSKLSYTTTPTTVCVGDTGRYLYASFQYFDEKRVESTQYIAKGKDTVNAENTYTYQSSDSMVVLVDPSTGLLYPLTKGSTTLYILDKDGRTVGKYNVVVASERTLQSFSISGQNTMKLSATGNTEADEVLTMKLTAKDQLGGDVDVDYSFSITSPSDAQDFSYLFNYKIAEDGTLTIWENVGLITDVTTNSYKQYTVTVTCTHGLKQLKQSFRITVKNTLGASIETSALQISKKSIDLKLNQDSLTAYESIIQVRSLDNSGYFVKLENINRIFSTREASTAAGAYSVLILYNGSNAQDIDITKVGKSLIVKPITLKGNEMKKAPLGSYEIILYRGTGSKAQKISASNFVLTDSTASISVAQNTRRIINTDLSTVSNALSFKRGDLDISSHVEIYDLKPIFVGKTYHISEISARIDAKEMNEDWAAYEYYTIVTIPTLIQFTVD